MLNIPGYHRIWNGIGYDSITTRPHVPDIELAVGSVENLTPQPLKFNFTPQQPLAQTRVAVTKEDSIPKKGEVGSVKVDEFPRTYFMGTTFGGY